MTRLFVCAASYLIAFTFAAHPAAQASGLASGLAPRSVWDGVYTDEQAERGRTSFGAHCSSCHGVDLRGGEAKPLRDERFWTDFKETPLDYLLSQISRNMPFSDDGSLAGTLPPSTYADIIAHILKTNGFPAGTQNLTMDSIAGVQIVAKEGPGELPAGAFAQVVGCLTRGAGNSWQLVKGANAVRVLTGRTLDPQRPLGGRDYALTSVITRLDKYAGFRMAATGKLIGAGGARGIEVSTISPVSERCD